MSIKEINKLTVKYHNKTVGYLAQLKNSRIAFQYDKEWLINGFSISPLFLPLSNKIYINEKNIFGGLYGVFNDSLPEGWGELLLKRTLHKKGINFDKLTPLQKLSIIHKGSLGALEYEPNYDLDNSEPNYDLDEIAKESNKIFEDKDINIDLDRVYNLGGSSGGSRPKIHIKYQGEEWIIKFPCHIDPKNIGEKEYRANQLASKCGIDVNEFKLFPSKICKGYFGAKRFDRNKNEKIHMISLAALLETTHRIPNLDYGHLFQMIEKICVDKNDLYEAFRRMCFNVFYKNKDDHSKNFAFLYDEAIKGYRLSPAYDITSVPNKSEHEMTVNGNGNPTEQDLLVIADSFKLSKKRCLDIIVNIKTTLKNEYLHFSNGLNIS